jgi:hypothetical protein
VVIGDIMELFIIYFSTFFLSTSFRRKCPSPGKDIQIHPKKNKGKYFLNIITIN